MQIYQVNNNLIKININGEKNIVKTFKKYSV